MTKDALERAKDWTTDGIRDCPQGNEYLTTAFGPVKFEDKEGYQNQNFLDTFVLQVIKGEHETIWPEKYASKKYVYPIPTWRERR